MVSLSCRVLVERLEFDGPPERLVHTTILWHQVTGVPSGNFSRTLGEHLGRVPSSPHPASVLAPRDFPKPVGREMKTSFPVTNFFMFNSE